MRCPKCGQWNRASFPKCIKCGTPLPLSERLGSQSPAKEAEESLLIKQSSRPKKTVVDHLGHAEEIVDKKEQHAKSMARLVHRIKEGEESQRELDERLKQAERFIAPGKAGGYISKAYGQSPVQDEPGKSPLLEQNLAGESFNTPKRIKQSRLFSSSFYRLRPLLLILAALSFVLAIVFVAMDYLKPKADIIESSDSASDVVIQASIIDDYPAHNIRLKVPQGKMVYIKELRKVVGPSDGHVSFDIPDYTWYEDHKETLGKEETYLPESMDVSFTPYLREDNGNLSPLNEISYTIDIPESDFLLLNPNTHRIKSSLQTYIIRFQVDPLSNVYIKRVDEYSPLNIQNGLVNYNAAVSQGVENKYTFLIKTEHQRIRELEIIIDREKQAFPLDLASSIDEESSRDRLTISGSTIAGAELTVLSPHEKLDLSQMSTVGNFKFSAIFTKYGTNTITIQAKYGGETVTIEHQVYYSPDANTYTSKAWALNDGFGYSNLLTNLSAKIEAAQVYVVYGKILEIISDKPQLAIVDASDGKTTGPLYVLLENQTKRTWEVGESYRIYAEASGMYDSYPRLMARFTYLRKK